MSDKIFTDSKRIPSLLESFYISLTGELTDSDYNLITLSDFNNRTGLNITDVLVLVCVTYHQFKWAPIYWSSLKVLSSIEGITTPESLLLGLDNPVESKEYPGYYLIPYYSNYVISPCGKLLKR